MWLLKDAAVPSAGAALGSHTTYTIHLTPCINLSHALSSHRPLLTRPPHHSSPGPSAAVRSRRQSNRPTARDPSQHSSLTTSVPQTPKILFGFVKDCLEEVMGVAPSRVAPLAVSGFRNLPITATSHHIYLPPLPQHRRFNGMPH
jgi:hypothetical protein